MTDLKKSLELRKAKKRRKPNFASQDSHKKVEIPTGYRKPRGWQSKIRLNKKGYRKKVKPGYKSPGDVRNMHPSGLFPVVVSTPADIANITEERGIIISSTVGTKKRLEIIDAAQKANVTILNIKNVDEFKKEVKEILAANKEARLERKSKATTKKAVKKEEKKDEKKENKEETKAEGKKTEEKKEEKQESKDPTKTETKKPEQKESQSKPEQKETEVKAK